LASEVVRTGKTLSQLASVMTTLPQVLINVPGVDRTKVYADPELNDFVAHAQAELGETGRVLLRPSGTEDLVRVMVEAKDLGSAQSWAERIAVTVEKRLAL
jgi:Phosphomannomutase